MPFTLAHPAAVLPLRAVRHLRTAPLFVGAMVPDSPAYLPGGIARYVPVTHSFVHSYTIDLALGYAALAVLFTLRMPLTALLGSRARTLCLRSLAPFRQASAWLPAAPAILLGIWSHLLWDSFTHKDGWIVHRVAALRAPFSVGSYDGTVYHALQYLSSVIGLCILVLWYDRLATPAPAAGSGAGAARSAAGPVLLLAVTAAVLIGAVQAVGHFEQSRSVYRTLDLLLIAVLRWFAIMYLTAGIVLTLERGAPQSPAARG